MRTFKPHAIGATRVTGGTPPPATSPARTAKVHTEPAVRYPGQDLLTDPVTAEIVLAVWGGQPAVTVPSPPGSGKTRLTVQLAALLAHRAGLRVGIAAQTRAQTTEIARRLGAISDPERVAVLWQRGGARPDVGDCPIISNRLKNWPSDGGAVRVATTAKWLRADPQRLGTDVLIVDEAYQCTYGDLCALGAMTAGQVVLVGDPGQIDPVVTGDVSRWVDSATGPHVPCPQALAAAYPGAVNAVALKYTWRLGPVTTALVQKAFYPSLAFTSRRPEEHLSVAGRRLPELAHHVIAAHDGPTSATMVAAVEGRVRQLLTHGSLTDANGTRALRDSDVAVVVPHVAQAAAVRATLSDFPAVLCGTANALQGLERAAVVAVHSMVGKRGVDPFSLDSARLCVMLSRHRSHLTVLVDDTTGTVLARHGDDPAVAAATVVWHQILATDPT